MGLLKQISQQLIKDEIESIDPKVLQVLLINKRVGLLMV